MNYQFFFFLVMVIGFDVYLLFLLLFRYLCMPENQDPQFLLEYRGPVTMKGKNEPMNVWFLSRERELSS